jgi:hypothetical protein
MVTIIFFVKTVYTTALLLEVINPEVRVKFTYIVTILSNTPQGKKTFFFLHKLFNNQVFLFNFFFHFSQNFKIKKLDKLCFSLDYKTQISYKYFSLIR